MRLKKYLKEEKLDIKKEIYDEALKALSKQHKIDKKYLEYIGYVDLKWKSPDAKLIHFNINKKEHPHYKSTIAYKYGYKV